MINEINYTYKVKVAVTYKPSSSTLTMCLLKEIIQILQESQEGICNQFFPFSNFIVTDV